MKTSNTKFRGKNFTTFILSWIFLILSFSGGVIFFTPAGRIANWTHWTFWGLSKDEWQGLHLVFASLFLICAAVHLFFNWRVLVSYLKTKRPAEFRSGKEFFAASVITVLFVVISLADWQPASMLAAGRDHFRQKDSAEEISPPLPHAEDMTIKEIGLLTGMEEGELLKKIKEKGFAAKHDSITLLELASQNSISPSRLYSEVARKDNTSNERRYTMGKRGELGKKSIEERSEILHDEAGERTSAGRSGGRSPGFGRKSVRELCADAGVAVEEGLKKLKSRGITARGGYRVKSLSLSYNVRPSDIARYIEDK